VIASVGHALLHSWLPDLVVALAVFLVLYLLRPR